MENQSTRRIHIILVNVIIMAGILGFVVFYSGYKNRDSYRREIESFESTTLTMEKVTENSEPLVTPLGEYVTNEKAVNLRKSPDVMADPVVKLKKGEHVWVVEDLGAWAKVADENGRVRGYVMTYFLDLVELAQPEPVQFSALDTEWHTCVCGTESCTCGAEDCDCGNAAK